MNSEPIITTNSIVAAAGAFLTLLVAFGLPISEEQRQAVLNFLMVVIPIFLGVTVVQTLVARNFTYSRDSVEQLTGLKDPVVPLAEAHYH